MPGRSWLRTGSSKWTGRCRQVHVEDDVLVELRAVGVGVDAAAHPEQAGGEEALLLVVDAVDRVHRAQAGAGVDRVGRAVLRELPALASRVALGGRGAAAERRGRVEAGLGDPHLGPGGLVRGEGPRRLEARDVPADDRRAAAAPGGGMSGGLPSLELLERKTVRFCDSCEAMVRVWKPSLKMVTIWAFISCGSLKVICPRRSVLPWNKVVGSLPSITVAPGSGWRSAATRTGAR
jgi:hypothetical protein